MRTHRHLHPQSLRAVACSHPPRMATPVQSTYQERGQGKTRVAQYKLPRPHWTVMHVRVGHGLVPRPSAERERVGARAWKPTKEVAEPASVADGDKQHGAPSFTISVILLVVATVGSRAHRISAASHCTSAAFFRPSQFQKLRTRGLQMSSYVSPDAWILFKAMLSF